MWDLIRRILASVIARMIFAVISGQFIWTVVVLPQIEPEHKTEMILKAVSFAQEPTRTDSLLVIQFERQRAIIKAHDDSVMASLVRIDSCIDRHFRTVKYRLSRIEEGESP